MSDSPQFTIRRAERADAASLMHLITSLAEFEKLTPPDAAAKDRLIADGFCDHPKFEAWLAFWEGEPEPVGYAFIFFTYSTFLAQPTLYLEDLFVLPDYRKRGIGRGLLRHCIQLASERGCGRMEWTCLDWNTNAQAVYKRLGARRMDEWYLYRLTEDEMNAALEQV